MALTSVSSSLQHTETKIRYSSFALSQWLYGEELVREPLWTVNSVTDVECQSSSTPPSSSLALKTARYPTLLGEWREFLKIQRASPLEPGPFKISPIARCTE